MENYTKLRIIGTGSFGTVWLIRSKDKRRNYVLKEISLSIIEERQRSILLNEVKVLSQLRHMNIIRYKEAFLSNGFLCISMEYAQEGDLSQRIQKQHGQMLPKAQIIDWFVQLCLALKYIHGINILHRDIKCQNIFISKENVIKLGDFGIARVLQNTLDHAQTVVGTPYYLSPEICQRQPYNHKSDIWALGCVLYEMIVLRHPFESTDFPQLVLKIFHGDYVPISENHGTLLQDLVSVLLRVEPKERPSAKQILHIPAMQPYVNKVLTRGKTQRSESVSCSEGQSVRKSNVWRKPDIIPSLESTNEGKRRSEYEVDVVKSAEDSKSFSEGACQVVKGQRDVVNVETSQTPKKRILSEVFLVENDHFDEMKHKKLKPESEKDLFHIWRENDKENYYPTEDCPLKHRSYSTSIVRESAERSPLAPLNKLQVRLHATYDVIHEEKPIFQSTYTKSSNLNAHEDDEIFGSSGKTSDNGPGCHNGSGVENISALKQDKTATPRSHTEFLRIFLDGSSTIFKSISSDSRLKEYVQEMKCALQKSLGVDMFNALHKYLCLNVKKDLSSGVDVCEVLFDALGEDGIVFLPLMLQYMKCESHLST